MEKRKDFKFEIGDIVQVADKENSSLITHGGKEYKEHLKVVFRFYDGDIIAYVLDTGDDDVCVVTDEPFIALEQPCGDNDTAIQQESPESQDADDENDDQFYFGYVFHINKRPVAANDLDDAIRIFKLQHGTEFIESIKAEDKLTLIQKMK